MRLNLIADSERQLRLTTAKLPRLRCPCLVVACLLLLFVLGSCRSSTESSVTFDDFFITPVLEQRTTTRAWRDIDVHKLFELSPDSFLNPIGVKVDRNGNIYVADFGDMTVKRFGPDGTYKASYGEGSGQGPGELISILDLGAVADSLVYIVDNTARRILLFSFSGAFLRHEAYDTPPVRYQMTGGGRGYTLISHNATLFRSQYGEEVTDFGALVDNQTGHGYALATGVIATHGEGMIYVPIHFPVIVRYNPDGSVAYARTTPDYGRAESPEWETMDLGGTRAYRVMGGSLHGDVAVNEEEVFVHVLMPPDEDAIDVYRAETGDYVYSLRLPDSSGVIYTHVRDDRMYRIVETSDGGTLSVFGLTK